MTIKELSKLLGVFGSISEHVIQGDSMYPTLSKGDHILAHWGTNMNLAESDLVIFQIFVDGLGVHRLLLELPWKNRLFYLEGGDAETVYSIIPRECIKAKVFAIKRAGKFSPPGINVFWAQLGSRKTLLRQLLRPICPVLEMAHKWSTATKRSRARQSMLRGFITFLFQCALPSLIANILLFNRHAFSKFLHLLGGRIAYYLSSVPLDWQQGSEQEEMERKGAQRWPT